MKETSDAAGKYRSGNKARVRVGPNNDIESRLLSRTTREYHELSKTNSVSNKLPR